MCVAVVTVAINLAPAIETVLPSNDLCVPGASKTGVAIVSTGVVVGWVIAAGALFKRFSIVALLVAVLTADLAAFWLAAENIKGNC